MFNMIIYSFIPTYFQVMYNFLSTNMATMQNQTVKYRYKDMSYKTSSVNTFENASDSKKVSLLLLSWSSNRAGTPELDFSASGTYWIRLSSRYLQHLHCTFNWQHNKWSNGAINGTTTTVIFSLFLLKASCEDRLVYWMYVKFIHCKIQFIYINLFTMLWLRSPL